MFTTTDEVNLRLFVGLSNSIFLFVVIALLIYLLKKKKKNVTSEPHPQIWDSRKPDAVKLVNILGFFFFFFFFKCREPRLN
jgi:amino acid transporter